MALSMNLAGPQLRPVQSKPRAAALRLQSRPSIRAAPVCQAQAEGPETFPQEWLRKDPLVLVLGFFGWTLPSMIPVPALGGESLFGQFTASIGEQLAHFPVGPALTDRFWTLMIGYHAGLFAALFFGQIGFQGRKQQYW